MVTTAVGILLGLGGVIILLGLGVKEIPSPWGPMKIIKLSIPPKPTLILGCGVLVTGLVVLTVTTLTAPPSSRGEAIPSSRTTQAASTAPSGMPSSPQPPPTPVTALTTPSASPKNVLTDAVTTSPRGILTVKVTAFVPSDEQTTVDFSITNSSTDPVDIEFASKELEIPGVPTLTPNPFVGSWVNNIQGGGTVTEELAFGSIPASADRATLSITGIQAYHYCDKCQNELVVDLRLQR